VAPPGLAAAGTGGFAGGLLPAAAAPGLATTGGGLGFDPTGGLAGAVSVPALFFFHGGADEAPFAPAIPGNTATGLVDAFATIGAGGAFGAAARGGGGGGAAGSAFGGTSSR